MHRPASVRLCDCRSGDPASTRRTSKTFSLRRCAAGKPTSHSESLCLSRDTASGVGRDASTPQARQACTRWMISDTQTDMLLGEPKSAICVQRFDDSLNSAIHTTYRSWLRSSSMREPRDPPSKVVSCIFSSSRRPPPYHQTLDTYVVKNTGGAGGAAAICCLASDRHLTAWPTPNG